MATETNGTKAFKGGQQPCVKENTLCEAGALPSNCNSSPGPNTELLLHSSPRAHTPEASLFSAHDHLVVVINPILHKRQRKAQRELQACPAPSGPTSAPTGRSHVPVLFPWIPSPSDCHSASNRYVTFDQPLFLSGPHLSNLHKVKRSLGSRQVFLNFTSFSFQFGVLFIFTISLLLQGFSTCLFQSILTR